MTLTKTYDLFEHASECSCGGGLAAFSSLSHQSIDRAALASSGRVGLLVQYNEPTAPERRQGTL